jgi:hypothetical protein
MPEPNRTSGIYAHRHGDYLYDVDIDEAPAGQSRRFYARAVNILRLAPGQPVSVTPELPEESGSTFDAALSKIEAAVTKWVSHQARSGRGRGERIALSQRDERRRHDRISGPFDGRRIRKLQTSVQIYDLSAGGCFINSLHDQAPGIAVVLEIELPDEGWIRVKCETLYTKPGFGFAVRFVDMTDGISKRLERGLRKIRT